MTKVDIDELRRKAQAATAGEWINNGVDMVYAKRTNGGGVVAEISLEVNRAYIAAASPATILALCDALEAARQAIVNANTLMERACDLMTPDQVGQWSGVASWMTAEYVDALAALDGKAEVSHAQPD